MEDECAQRRRDVLYLQECLDGEEEHRRVAVTEVARSEPTLQGVYIRFMSHSRTKTIMDCNKVMIKGRKKGVGKVQSEPGRCIMCHNSLQA